MSRLVAIGGGVVVLALCGCPGAPAAPAQDPSGWTQRLPSGGLSLVEAPGDQPAHVTLAPNAALVDGVLDASAGIDIGDGPSIAGDTALRELGVQLPDSLTLVNMLCIRVDRALPPDVAGAYAWTAFASADNIAWTAVMPAGPVSFAPLQDRFEIPISGTRSRYLKVVTQPLPAGVTTDPKFTNVLVTELMLFSVTP